MKRHVTEPLLESERRSAAGSVDDRPIGRILVDMGKLKPKDVGRVFALHREKGIRFGEAARKLRLVKDADVEYALSVQFNYPYLKPGQGALGRDLVVAHAPFDAQAEILRDLRTQLLLHWVNGEQKVLAIVSPNTADGRSFLAANLAVVFAQLGEKTLLVDADMRFPRQHRIFGITDGVGLAHVLRGRAGIEAAERVAYFDNLTVLTAGAAPPNPLELLSRKTFSVVLVDTPASARSSDAQVVAARADGALMVARQNQTKVAELDRLRRTVAACSVPVIGTVLNTV
jgi:chain length determinant protein tyrosine kinase EpsG